MARQAILVRSRYDVNGNRFYTARASAGTMRSYGDPSLSHEENERNLALAFAEKFGWEGTFYRGGMPEKGSDWSAVYVQIDDRGPEDKFKVGKKGEKR